MLHTRPKLSSQHTAQAGGFCVGHRLTLRLTRVCGI